MGRILGVIWIIVAVINGVVSGFSQVAGTDTDAISFLAGFAGQALWGILAGIAIGLTYWLISKASASVVPILFGWIHLVFYTLGSAAFMYGNVVRNAAMQGDGDFSMIGIIYSAGAGLQIISSLIFIVALIVALASERGRPNHMRDY